MSLAYKAVGWNRQKRIYDTAFLGMLFAALTVYAGVTVWHSPSTTAETLVIRLTALGAIVLLHVILAIGPLARLDARFLPLLYNRRHLGVTMFLLGAVHGVFTIVQFHADGDLNPLISAFTAYARDYVSFLRNPVDVAHFPFEIFGALALAILFVMAATSHDFWLRNLGPSFWKTMHMGVYVAYGLLVVHVVFGALQSERSAVYPTALALGFVVLVTLHLLAFAKERRLDRLRHEAEGDGFEKVAQVSMLRRDRGFVAMLDDERIAVFLQNDRVHVLSNACRHQGGPLGEGRVVGGCLTCPWHGFQYRVEDGCSPPPFTEVVRTFPVRVIGGDVWVARASHPLRQRNDGALVGIPAQPGVDAPFYIGWQGAMAAAILGFLRPRVVVLAIGVLAVMAALACVQAPVDRGTFEFGVERKFEGILHLDPIPLLEIPAAGATRGLVFALVGAGKFGPPAVVQGNDNARVAFSGSLIDRDGAPMIEMNRPDTFRVIARNATPGSGAQRAGEVTLVGELVDTKCFFGVMRPATGKIHRGCAVRCLSGGVPPGLLVRDAEGNGVVFLLAGEPGRPLDFDPGLAARKFEVNGELVLDRNLPVVRVRTMTLRD